MLPASAFAASLLPLSTNRANRAFELSGFMTALSVCDPQAIPVNPASAHNQIAACRIDYAPAIATKAVCNWAESAAEGLAETPAAVLL